MKCLPEPLIALADYDQFLLYKLVPDRLKTKKIPINPNTIKPYEKGSRWQEDPNSTVSPATAIPIASAIGDEYGVGFLLTKNDPFWFLDIDVCLTSEGAWTDIASQLCKRLAGCAIEISQSGKGLHIFGSGSVPDHLCKNTSLNIELYTENRFVALTGNCPCGGSAGPESTEIASVVADYFAPRKKNAPTEWTSVPDAEWSGPEDDDQLIELALKGPGSAASVFGGKAGFNDLWTKNEVVLGRSYPANDEKRPYDASSADLALAQMLAFWTGKNCERIERLMFRSGLVRDKWIQRPDYLKGTIRKAVSNQGEVYCSGRKLGSNSGPHEDSQDSRKFDLSQFALNGMAAEMETKMLDDKYVLGRLAIMGQSTVIFARPNAGKTLLTIKLLIEAISTGEIQGREVYYINADDTYKGLVTKLKLAEEYNFCMLAPGHQGFQAKALPQILFNLIDQNDANGKILILDTFKKFADLMSKEKSSMFGETVRQFVSHGGTVISLAHVNKHRGEDGKLIHAGTTDSVDDTDCAYLLDIIAEDEFSKVRTVRFENFKSRGDVAIKADYQYNANEKVKYLDRLLSVRAVSEDEAAMASELSQRAERVHQNRAVIDIVKEGIRTGITKKTELCAHVMKNGGITRKKVINILDEHTGPSPGNYQFWQVEVGEKNSHTYWLNE
jgi:primase-polymerase (primpol)-like protein